MTDPSLSARNSTEYSRFTLPLQFKREGLGYFIKTFFGLFVAASIAFLAFFMKPIDLDPRFFWVSVRFSRRLPVST